MDLTDDLRQEIQDKGELVFLHAWDTNSPGMGADREDVYFYRGKYYYLSNAYESAGPYESLDDVIQAQDQLLTLVDTSVAIKSTLLTTEELLNRLNFAQAQDDLMPDSFQVVINDRRFEFHKPDGMIDLGEATDEEG